MSEKKAKVESKDIIVEVDNVIEERNSEAKSESVTVEKPKPNKVKKTAKSMKKWWKKNWKKVVVALTILGSGAAGFGVGKKCGNSNKDEDVEDSDDILKLDTSDDIFSDEKDEVFDEDKEDEDFLEEDN